MRLPNFGFFCSVNHLSGPFRKHMITCMSSKGHGFVICDWWISICFVCWVFQGSLLCALPVSGNNWPVSLLWKFFCSFLFLSLPRIKQRLPPSVRWQKIHSPLWFPSLFLSRLESVSAKLGEYVTLWFALTPPSLKWLMEWKNRTWLSRNFCYHLPGVSTFRQCKLACKKYCYPLHHTVKMWHLLAG